MTGADRGASPVSVPEVLRAAGSWIAVAMLSMIAFFAVRTLDRIEIGQQAQAVQNGEILQQLATINSDIKHRDKTDERARLDVGEIRRQLRELEQRVDGIEMRGRP